MICKVFLFSIAISILMKVQANADCECKGKVTANLDSIIQLLNNMRDNYPVCCPERKPIDCEDILRSGQNESGIYEVWPQSRAVRGPIRVYCDMDTDGGGWTVIQRRGNYLRPKDYFYQDWKSYKEGFGTIDKDFWLGNDNIFGLSNQRLYSVRFDLQDIKGARRYAVYDYFWIDDEEHQYTLHIKGYKGNAGDCMTEIHNGQIFSTKDFKNDNACANKFKGGWWYRNREGYPRCHYANLNGLYYRGKHVEADGMSWNTFRGYQESLESTEIKIRSTEFRSD